MLFFSYQDFGLASAIGESESNFGGDEKEIEFA
jgi:hypothetical protein